LNKEEALELANKTGFNAIDVDVLKLEASGREYYRLHFDKTESLIMCYLDPEKANHTKFLHVSIFLKVQVLILLKLFWLTKLLE
jgi:hypothetical protein